MIKVSGIVSLTAAGIFGYIAFTREWNTALDVLMGIFAIGMAAIFLLLAIDTLFLSK